MSDMLSSDAPTEGAQLMETLIIRELTRGDCPALMNMILEFAADVGVNRGEVTATVEQLETAFFGGKTTAECLIGFIDGEAAGYMVFYPTFSTFLARSCLFIEDLYVRPAYQRLGLGRAFLNRIRSIARHRGCPRLEWCCLDDNINAITFYHSHGARRLLGTGVYRLDGSALEKGEGR